MGTRPSRPTRAQRPLNPRKGTERRAVAAARVPRYQSWDWPVSSEAGRQASRGPSAEETRGALASPPRRNALSFFLSPVSSRGGLQAPPRGSSDGTQNTQASPDGEDWPPRGYPANSLSLLRREAGGSMTPGLGLRPGSTGAPGGRRPRKKTQTPRSRTQGAKPNRKSTTLSGGSLGSCVDEERS